MTDDFWETITEKKARKILEEVAETEANIKNAQHQRAEAAFKHTGKPCAVCGTEIVREVRQEYRGDPMNLIIGPGSQNQMSTVIEMYCEPCGILYHHLPQ